MYHIHLHCCLNRLRSLALISLCRSGGCGNLIQPVVINRCTVYLISVSWSISYWATRVKVVLITLTVVVGRSSLFSRKIERRVSLLRQTKTFILAKTLYRAIGVHSLWFESISWTQSYVWAIPRSITVCWKWDSQLLYQCGYYRQRKELLLQSPPVASRWFSISFNITFTPLEYINEFGGVRKRKLIDTMTSWC